MGKIAYDTDESYGWLIATASQQLNQRLTRIFAENGLNLTTEQWSLLVYLMNEDGLSQQELAERYKRSKVTVFKLIGQLEKRGFVHRLPDEKDGRVKRVFLTDMAKKSQKLMLRLAGENLAVATLGLTEEQLGVLKASLKKMIKNTL